MFILPFVTDQASRQLQALGFQWDAILCDKQDISAITVLIDGQNHSGLNAPAARNIFPCSFALDRDEAALPHRFDLASHRKSVLAGRGPGDRKSVVSGTSVSVRVDLGGGRGMKK